MGDRSGFPALETRRLWLREIVDADAPALFAIHGDPQVMRWFGSDPLVDQTAALLLVRSFANWRTLVNPGTRWGLQLKDRDGLIGSCGLFSWNRQWRKCSVGYELAADAGGQGLMTEALQAILAWGFGQMHVNRIDAQIHPDNARSIRLALKLGFVEEGRLREIAWWGGQHHDMLQFSLLHGDWQASGWNAGSTSSEGLSEDEGGR